MERKILFRAKSTDSGEWVEGSFIHVFQEEKKNAICGKDRDVYFIAEMSGKMYTVRPETVCQYVGLADKNCRKIFEGDIVKLVLPDGEIRYFKVSIKNVMRKVLCHPDFDDAVSKVEITGIVFEWNGYELFPCIDTYGVADYKMMELTGNIFDNPELLKTDG